MDCWIAERDSIERTNGRDANFKSKNLLARKERFRMEYSV